MLKNISNKISCYIDKFIGLSVFREASFYTLSNLLNQIMAFIAMIFVSRYLGPSNLGIISFVQNYCVIFLCLLGSADYYFSWNISKVENKIIFIREYITHRFYISILLTFIAIFIAYITLPPDLLLYSLITVFSFLFTAFSPLYLYSLYEKRAKLIFIIQSSSAFVLFVLKIMFVIFEFPLIYFIFLSAVDITTMSVLYFIYYFWHYKSWRRDLVRLDFFSPIKTLKFYFDIRYAVLIPFLWMILLRADQMLLGFLSSKFSMLNIQGGAYNMGIYSAAVKLAEIPNILAGVLYLILISRLGKFLKNNDDQKIKKILILYTVLGIIISLIVSALSAQMISIVYGQKFFESIEVLRVYALSIVFVYIINFYTALSGAKDNHKSQVTALVFGLILNIITVILFTFIWGLTGTAWATVLSYGFVAIILHYKNKT